MRNSGIVQTIRATLLIVGGALCGLADPAWGQAISRVIFSNLSASPTSEVPGFPGVRFNPGTGTQFDRPFGSPNGQRWIFAAQTNETGTPDLIVIGGGTTSAGAAVVVKEGTPTFFDGTVNYGIIDTQLGINDSGQYAFSADTTAATTADAVVVRWNGTAFELMAREGSPAIGQPAGVGYGSTNNAVHILQNGDVRFRSAALTGATTQQVLYNLMDPASGIVIAQTDTTIPLGQLVAPDQSIDNLTSNRFVSSSTGSTYLYHGDLNGPVATDLVMVRTDTVLAQEGVPLPGSGFTSNILNLSADAGSQQLSHNGARYLCRGSNADGIDWVVRDGQVVAATDQPITPGNTELYDDAIFAATYFLNAVNGMGDYIIGGVTNAADVNANAVLVWNGRRVILRENAPVDVDGNGLADDNVFISVFNNDDSFLTDNLHYYFMADLRDGSTPPVTLGQAYLVIRICPGDIDGDNDVDQSDLGVLLAAFGVSGGGDLDGDGDTDQSDLGILLGSFGCNVTP